MIDFKLLIEMMKPFGNFSFISSMSKDDFQQRIVLMNLGSSYFYKNKFKGECTDDHFKLTYFGNGDRIKKCFAYEVNGTVREENNRCTLTGTFKMNTLSFISVSLMLIISIYSFFQALFSEVRISEKIIILGVSAIFFVTLIVYNITIKLTVENEFRQLFRITDDLTNNENKKH